LLDRLIASRRQRKIEEAEKRREDAEERYKEARRHWAAQVDALKEEARRIARQCKSDVAAWEGRRNAWVGTQSEKNAAVDRRRDLYKKGDPDAVIDYCDMVLSASKYPDCFPRSWELDYVPDTKILLADYSLPDVEDLPKVLEVKYIQTRHALKEIHLSESEANKLYDDVLYQTALRTIHEILQADVMGAVQSVVFNGWVRSIDKRTGQEVNACIMSLQVGREEFTAINLAQVDPKACFRSLKGVGSAKLHGLAPVAPIMQINREDKRFVPAYAVVDRIQEGDNLATMDWYDFEHLIRELFEEEFSPAGGEVKVMRASRDGGVDAVVFDPDPIRGGKIVIQAKRYTNAVGVSAVRDLYGTLLNEGANKGILVTTSNFGPDAYEFAKGKPITLLDGGNLLHLLGKHGHKARIDLKEAKQLLAEQEKTE
jgi:restriction system protein